MFSFILIVYQVIFIVMLGAFFRASSYTSLSSQYITFGLITILGFVLMSSTYRKLTLFSLVLFIFISFLSIQTNILFMAFWSSCFTFFSKQINLTNGLLINSVYAAFGVIITCLDFIGLFEYWQVFALISFVMAIGYGLCSAVILYGLDTFDGGNAISTFLFSAMCSLMIWFICIRGKISILQHKKSESYINHTLGFIGLCLALFSWPVLNMGGATLSFINTSLSSTTSLLNSAYINTLSALGVSLITSSILSSSSTNSQKLKPKVFIECFINAGIIVSCYNDISLHPVVGMTLAFLTTVITLVVDKNLVSKTDVRNQSDFKMVLLKFSKIVFRLIFSFVSVSIGAIVLKTRDSSSLNILANFNYSQKAGLIVAGWIIVLVIGLVFGLIGALSINAYLNYRSSATQIQKIVTIVDQLFFDQLQSEIFPIYKDILQVQPDKTYEEDLTRRMLHESLMMQQQIPINIYESNKKNTNHDTNESGKLQKQTIVIKNDFSKTNIQKRDINLSAMKINKHEQDQVAVQNVHTNRQQNFMRQKINVEYSPIHHLKGQQSRFQSLMPTQSRVQKPRQLKAIPSSSRMVQIHVIEQETMDKKSLSRVNQKEKNQVRKKLSFSDNMDEEEIGGQIINRINS